MKETTPRLLLRSSDLREDTLKLSGWVLLAAGLLLLATYLGLRTRREAMKEEKQHQEDLSRADYEGMTAEGTTGDHSQP